MILISERNSIADCSAAAADVASIHKDAITREIDVTLN